MVNDEKKTVSVGEFLRERRLRISNLTRLYGPQVPRIGDAEAEIRLANEFGYEYVKDPKHWLESHWYDKTVRAWVERPVAELVGISRSLSERIASEPSLVHTLTPEQFEEFICDRLFAMGLEPRRVGSTFQKDGGIDFLFWPRAATAFPFLGAAQVKHHRDPRRLEGPATVREFAGRWQVTLSTQV